VCTHKRFSQIIFGILEEHTKENIFCVSVKLAARLKISPARNQPSQLPGDRELADVEIANPGAPDISMSLQSSETPQNTSTNRAQDGTRSN